MINCPTEVYRYEEPDEYRLPAHGAEIPYDWAAEGWMNENVSWGWREL